MVDPTDHRPEPRPTDQHPLSQPRLLSRQPDVADIPLRYRPRFTTTEAIILNTLVNASPEMVSLQDLARVIGRRSPSGIRMMESSVRQAMVVLRAKIGEKAWNPTQIRSVYKRYKTPGGKYECDHLVGYQWVDPYDTRS